MTSAPSSPTIEGDRYSEAIELDDMAPTHDEPGVSEPLISNDSQAQVARPHEDLTGTANLFVWTLTISACVSGLLFGYDTGVISSTLVSIGPDLSHRNLTNLDKGLITSCTSAFALVASPIAGVLADRIGRKNILVIADLLFVVGALWQAYTNTVSGMIFGRSVVGLAIGAASLITPLYISELSPSHLRGRLVTVSLLLITGGQVVAYVIGWLFSTMHGGWRWMVGLGALPAVVQIGLLLLMPETPRYLCVAHKQAKAKAILVRVYEGISADPTQTATSIMRAISQELNEESESRLALAKDRPGSSRLVLPATLSSLLFYGPHRRALTITCMLQGLQQCCGFNSVMYFSATIFEQLKFSSPTLISLSVAGTNFLFTVAAFYLIDRIGRRRILLLTIPIMVVALFLCAVSFALIEAPQQPRSPSSVSDGLSSNDLEVSKGSALAVLGSLLLYVSAYATGLGPVPWQQSEMFPLSVRSLGSSLATATNWGSNTIVALTFLPMMQFLTPGWTFVCYAAICVLGWVAVKMIYPETMGLGLEEVSELLSEGWGVGKSADIVRRRQNDDG
jgi:MFS transporter, SP family, solute carrier family 2 (myo-inositol transporter), member 13